MLKYDPPDESVIIEQVQKNGIYILKNVIEDSFVQSLKHEVLCELKDEKYDYEFGKARNFGHLSSFPDSSDIKDFFLDPWFRNVAWRNYIGNFDFGQCVMATHDFKFDGSMARNGFLHFDRGHCFKFLVYLTEVTENDGPFMYLPGTNQLGSQLREKAWNDKVYDEVPNRIELDYPELGLTSKDCIPMTGPAGTIAIFDTDTFHMGGLVKNGERIVLRLHCKP